MSSVSPGIRPVNGAAPNITDRFTEWSLNWVPDSMVFVLTLTIIVFLMALGLTSSSALDLVNDYGNSFWLLLTFSMQLSILMVTS